MKHTASDTPRLWRRRNHFLLCAVAAVVPAGADAGWRALPELFSLGILTAKKFGFFTCLASAYCGHFFAAVFCLSQNRNLPIFLRFCFSDHGVVNDATCLSSPLYWNAAAVVQPILQCGLERRRKPGRRTLNRRLFLARPGAKAGGAGGLRFR